MSIWWTFQFFWGLSSCFRVSRFGIFICCKIHLIPLLFKTFLASACPIAPLLINGFGFFLPWGSFLVKSTHELALSLGGRPSRLKHLLWKVAWDIMPSRAKIGRFAKGLWKLFLISSWIVFWREFFRDILLGLYHSAFSPLVLSQIGFWLSSLL